MSEEAPPRGAAWDPARPPWSRLGWGRVPLSDAVLLGEAALCLGLARVLLLGLPFRLASRALGRPRADTPDAAADAHQRRALRVGWAVQAAAARVPWEAVCLPQAIAARLMLRRRGVPCTTYLGVRRSQRDLLAAHAWVRVGQVIVTGRAGHDAYAVVSSFA